MPESRLRDPIVLLRARSRRQLDEAALVLRAVGIAHAVTIDEDGFPTLVVPRTLERAALRELAHYRAENPVESAATAERPRRVLVRVWPGLIAYAAVMVFIFIEQAGGTEGRISLRGRLDANEFLDGEWWRCVTALLLHVDTPHLASNLLFGAVFGALLSQLVGNGVGWSAILISGALGNALDAWIQPLGHVSMGASTAVFSALGILTSLSLRLGSELRDGRLRRWAPLVMGVALLGLLGTGGVRTDVPAHALGFGTGLALGALLAPAVRHRAPGFVVQGLAAGLGAALLALAWMAAWTPD